MCKIVEPVDYSLTFLFSARQPKLSAGLVLEFICVFFHTFRQTEILHSGSRTPHFSSTQTRLNTDENFSMQKGEAKKNWTITSTAFHHLLDWLDAGENSDGRNYLEMQRRLVAYFDRKNCLAPDELADETLNRVARRLVEEGDIKSETPARYCYITARFVFMEYWRETDRKNVSLDDVLRQRQTIQLAAPDEDEEKKVREKMLDCLQHCTDKLDSTSRDVIVNYYYGTERIKIENRRRLAESLGISGNALSIRACRIRDKLETCVGKCVAD